jgi:hypothetical protein
VQYAYPKKAVLTTENVVVMSTFLGLYRSAPLTPIDTGTSEPAPIPSSFVVHQNYPNPFNPGTAVAFELPKTTSVEITITDALGRIVRTVPLGFLPAGHHIEYLDLTGSPGGMYLYTVRAGDAAQTRKMMLVK